MLFEQATNAQQVQHAAFDEAAFDTPTHHRRQRLVWVLAFAASLVAALAIAL
jgi:hypothetical protein